jgi:dolichol-phosphate mannosyltransferase
MRPLIVMPTFQEAENIDMMLRRLREVVPAADVLVVDDNSPDGTADLADKVGAEIGGVEVLRRPVKDGLGNAYRAGFAHGMSLGYDVLIQMDADFSHDPEAVPQLIKEITDGADVVIGSRYVPGGSIPHWPLYRRLLSKWGNSYATWILRLDVHDATAGFRAYRAPVLDGIGFLQTRSNGYALQMELTRRLAAWPGSVREVPITFTDRVRGTSKMPTTNIAEQMALVTWWGLTDRIRGRRPASGKATDSTGR